MKIVKYKNKSYTAVRPVSYEDDRLLSIEKQEQAKELFSQGVSSAEIAERLNVDENVLNVWHDNEARLEGISKSNKAFTEGKSKAVECTNIDTGISVVYPSLSACGRAVGARASTVRRNLLLKKKYKNYMFSYVD